MKKIPKSPHQEIIPKSMLVNTWQWMAVFLISIRTPPRHPKGTASQAEGKQTLVTGGM